MEFGILGSLQVRDESGTRAVAAAKQRALLAVLLLRSGCVVPLGTIADLIWDGRPPGSALSSLRNYVMRLRRVLGPAGERIVGREGGYLVEVDADELDLLRFNRLRQEGASAVDRGDYALAGALLADALGQWRGPALADVDCDALQRDACPRLLADRLDTLELKLEAERAADRYLTPLGELREFALAHPERESLWEHLILALLRNGRGTEAEAAYRRIRRTLQEEFGAAPGARLRELQRQFEPRSASGPHRTVPFQIPADLDDFTGRGREVAEAAEAVRAGVPVVITGRDGIGKSTLAVHVAHAVSASFPDGVLYTRLQTDAGEAVLAQFALAALLEALEADSGRPLPVELESRSALLRSRLAERSVLLVLDGAVDGAQVQPLLPNTSRSAAVITSRLRLDDLPGARHLELPPFSPAESAELLCRITGKARIAAEPRPARALLAACEDLPLAVRIAGTRLVARPGWSVRHLAERLSDRGRRLDELSTGRLDLRVRLAGGYRRLPRSAARALPRLAAADQQAVTVRDAAALLGLPPGPAERLLECLVDHRFLATAQAGSYRFPALVREFALEQAG